MKRFSVKYGRVKNAPIHCSIIFKQTYNIQQAEKSWQIPKRKEMPLQRENMASEIR